MAFLAFLWLLFVEVGQVQNFLCFLQFGLSIGHLNEFEGKLLQIDQNILGSLDLR